MPRLTAGTHCDKKGAGKGAAQPCKLRLYLRSDSGSSTLEGAIIVPIAIFVICLCVYVVIILFGQAQLQSSSGYAAHRVSTEWYSAGQNKNKLYRRMIDPDRDNKLKMASNVAEARLDCVSMPGYIYAYGDSRHKKDIFGETLAAGLRGWIIVPHLKVMKLFDYGNAFGAEYSAKSLTPDFAENIRRIRYVLEIEKKLEEESPEFAEMAESFNDMKDKIREFIGGMQ